MCIYNCSSLQFLGTVPTGSLGGSSNFAHELSGRVKVFVVVNIELLLLTLDHLFSNVTVCAFKSKYHWLFELMLFVRFND